MKPADRTLGMDRPISHRDLLHGMGALAAAHFFFKQNPKARILILDNNDDLGGCARRNEFQVGGRTLISYGGNQTLEEPSRYPDVIPEIPPDAKEVYLYTFSYRDFLSKHLNIREPEVFTALQDLTSDSGVGIEARLRG